VKAVFFDRDGVLNRVVFRDGTPTSPRNPDELDILPGAAEALSRLKDAGYALICVSNQPEIARGTLAVEALDAITAKLRQALPLDDVLICRHSDEDACDCRKPAPGLLFQAAAKHNLELTASFMVGDRWRDVEAGARAGCRTVMVLSDQRERAPAKAPDAIVESVEQAADWILQHAPSQAGLLH
jgi:D-glycero-D-manno-heptose 1,7-bisphosphate phosphatase